VRERRQTCTSCCHFAREEEKLCWRSERLSVVLSSRGDEEHVRLESFVGAERREASHGYTFEGFTLRIGDWCFVQEQIVAEGK